MVICQIMIQDFLFQHGGLDNGYGLYDLIIGRDYALALKEEGYSHEPFWYYNLDKFIAWCNKQMRCCKEVRNNDRSCYPEMGKESL